MSKLPSALLWPEKSSTVSVTLTWRQPPIIGSWRSELPYQARSKLGTAFQKASTAPAYSLKCSGVSSSVLAAVGTVGISSGMG